MTADQSGTQLNKTASTFFPSSLRRRGQANIAAHEWARLVRDEIVEAARPWREMSDDHLWGMMFGNTITRSWMVWSNGHCPSCNKNVPMYDWIMAPLEYPWKTRCPHCDELFPKNDFQQFYRSGLDSSGVFDPSLSDRSLLFNSEHPDPNDPLHGFAVDDGDGFVDGDNRWRFVGTYLIYGQWKAGILHGMKALATAHVVTGDASYAHKAGVLLDRVADLYPSFDFKTQAYLYEIEGDSGYVSTWHDACEETREMALAYDAVFEVLRDDGELVEFLSQKASEHGLANPKSSFEDIQRNIEAGLLSDPLANQHKIRSNHPRTPIAVATLLSILSWEENSDEFVQLLDEALNSTTKVDGVTGEKGLANYTAFTIQALAAFFALLGRVMPEFLAEILQRHPRLHDTFRFHIDTWCMQEYYPMVGDTGWFGGKVKDYAGVITLHRGEMDSKALVERLLPASTAEFLWWLYEFTDDPGFVQVLYHQNGGSVEGLPCDLFVEDLEAFQDGVKRVIANHGESIKLGSINKEEWGIAILRSGDGENQRALWLHYDSGGGHGHADGMNLGLIAKGLDLMPDLGYPPVQYGGWGAPRANWYRTTASHNTVEVDGKRLRRALGKTTLWADGDWFHGIRASSPNTIRAQQFERTALLIDLPAGGFYVVDIFRVVGGASHTRYMHSHFATLSTDGLNLDKTAETPALEEMRNFFFDNQAEAGWSAEWQIEDQYGYLEEEAKLQVKLTDFTNGALSGTCEGWVNPGGYSTSEEEWIPRVMVRRETERAPLESAFVGVIEVYEEQPPLKEHRRLGLQSPGGTPFSDAHVALELVHDYGRDLLISMDVENPLVKKPSPKEVMSAVQPDWSIETDGSLCLARIDEGGKVVRAALCDGSFLRVGGWQSNLDSRTVFVEMV